MRKKYFDTKIVNITNGIDGDGIPYVAYDNTEGDTPIKAEKCLDAYCYLVTFKPDNVVNTNQ